MNISVSFQFRLVMTKFRLVLTLYLAWVCFRTTLFFGFNVSFLLKLEDVCQLARKYCFYDDRRSSSYFMFHFVVNCLWFVFNAKIEFFVYRCPQDDFYFVPFLFLAMRQLSLPNQVTTQSWILTISKSFRASRRFGKLYFFRHFGKNCSQDSLFKQDTTI